MKPIAAIVAGTEHGLPGATLEALDACTLVGQRAVVGPGLPRAPTGWDRVEVDQPWSTSAVKALLRWLADTDAAYLLWVLKGAPEPPKSGLERLWHCARDAGALLTYSDYLDCGADGMVRPHPLIDYQLGSLRDDFDFGAMVLVEREALLRMQPAADLTYGAWYDLRLQLSRAGSVLRVPEPLYRLPDTDARKSGEKVFDYVDPRRREYQVEMERVATAHLEALQARLAPAACDPEPEEHAYPVTASVIIPVRNRVATVGEAVESALAQDTSFPFNVIVVDNHSDDGTSDVLARLAAADPRLVHHVPGRRDLGIGGCWHAAIWLGECGRFAVQLDSDDTYDGNQVLARVVAELDEGRCAVVIGSYTTVSSDLEPLPPGLIDHREWSDENGHNNALRIAGLGAPRAFHVPTLRKVGFPNVSYGEDYATVLRLCRSYRLGRIYDSLYWCRRWQGNSDSDLPLEVSNRYALYKDRVRSIEIRARQRLNQR